MKSCHPASTKWAVPGRRLTGKGHNEHRDERGYNKQGDKTECEESKDKEKNNSVGDTPCEDGNRLPNI